MKAPNLLVKIENSIALFTLNRPQQLNALNHQLIDELNQELEKIKNVSYVDSIKKAVENSDLVILHTEWNDFKLLNFKKLTKKQKIKIYDMRNMFSPLKMKKLKIDYFGVGR